VRRDANTLQHLLILYNPERQVSIFFAQKTQSSLTKFTGWMKRQERAIEIIFALIFGLLFLQIGLELFGVRL